MPAATDKGLWKATHERLAQGRAVHMARTNGQTWGQTPEGIRLTGMATFGPLIAIIVLRGEMVPPG